MGSFPIQSNTSCAYEWITHGVNGFLVKPDDLLGLAKCIKQALQRYTS
jgi:glycosyltransferase involved in cell wall biosynthesis